MAAARLPVVGEAIDDAVVAGFVSYFAGSNKTSTVKGYARSVRQILGEGTTFALRPGARLDD
eukprot:COSAG04_NODE_23551_length_336_cov_1.008439_1_plen_61_part_10